MSMLCEQLSGLYRIPSCPTTASCSLSHPPSPWKCGHGMWPVAPCIPALAQGAHRSAPHPLQGSLAHLPVQLSHPAEARRSPPVMEYARKSETSLPGSGVPSEEHRLLFGEGLCQETQAQGRVPTRASQRSIKETI